MSRPARDPRDDQRPQESGGLPRRARRHGTPHLRAVPQPDAQQWMGDAQTQLLPDQQGGPEHAGNPVTGQWVPGGADTAVSQHQPAAAAGWAGEQFQSPGYDRPTGPPPGAGGFVEPRQPAWTSWPRRPQELMPPMSDVPRNAANVLMRRPDTEVDRGELAALIRLRLAAVHRLTEITTNHAQEAWRRQVRQPVSPTAVALLFAVPYGGGAAALDLVLRTDVRTWNRDSKVADPARVLLELTRQVHRGWRDRSFDLRHALVNQPDERWTPQELACGPEFVGVAVSTLDTTEYGAWDRVRVRATSPDEVPSEAFIQFTDGGRIHLVRHAERRYDRIDRYASVALSPPGQPPSLLWEPTIDLNWIWPSHPRAYLWHFSAELARTVYWGWRAWR